MKKQINAYLFSVLMLIAAVVSLGGCSDTTVDPVVNGGGNVNTTVTGIVLDENKAPIAGATVTASGNSVQTGAGGEFIFNNISVPSGRMFVNVTASGYFNASRSEIPNSGNVTQLKIVMLTKTVTHTINSTAGGSADLSNGSQVVIQPNSVVTQGGSIYNGTVNMSVVYMDPTSLSFSETVQGGDMAAIRSDSSNVTLYSYGVLKVVMEGTGGESLQLSAGSTSTITTVIPASMVSTAPSTIPLWFFDEQTGMWREDGSAVKQGDKYVGTVSHFTDWNCDHPEQTGSIRGRVLDCNGLPLPGITIKVGQVTTTTDASGNYSRNVPAGIGFTVSIEASQNFGITGNPINVDPVAVGTVVTLPDFNVGCYPIIKGVFTDCNGNPLFGSVSGKWDNQIQASVVNNGSGFRMTVAPNKTVTLRFISSTGEIKDTTVQSPATAQTLDFGTIRLCGQIQQGENSFTINGAGYNNVFVNLNASAMVGFYYISNQETAISAVNGSGEFIALFFPGNNTGTFTGQNANINYQGINFVSTDSCNVTVTTYEAVGGIIKGTFDGTFDSPQGTAQINGKFFVIRQPDQN